jgi:hypothetical protein
LISELRQATKTAYESWVSHLRPSLENDCDLTNVESVINTPPHERAPPLHGVLTRTEVFALGEDTARTDESLIVRFLLSTLRVY